jgi:hypothetical protein
MRIARIDALPSPVYGPPALMPERSTDAIASWFVAAEELGEYIGIRFGHLQNGSVAPDWIFLRHIDYDGIGGFAELLRRQGALLPRLPQLKHPQSPSLLALLKALPSYAAPRRRIKWAPLDGERSPGTNDIPPTAVAWHVFDESITTQIRLACRKAGVTINSFLLKHLTKAIRPSIEDQSSDVPWMVPVNLRGKVNRGRDTANHTSYVAVRVRSYETAHDVHQKIYTALASGEHWANWAAYHSGNLLTPGMRRWLITKERCMSQWNLGSFSNLGDWDPERRLTEAGCLGDWLFCPPVLRCQPVGAGCVTFQNRLSLTLQVHPELTVNSGVPAEWLRNWIREIEIDLASWLGQTATYPVIPIKLPV